jgi:predicted nucleic acid-binding protein
LVIDASVTAAWVLPDEATPLGAELHRLALTEGMVVPFIWPVEMANILLKAERRGRIDADRRRRAAISLCAKPPEIDSLEQSSLCVAASALAGTHMLSVYDALYLEVALRRSLPLATFDLRLARAAQVAGVAVLGASAA